MVKHNWSIPNVLYTQYLDLVTGEELINSTLGISGDSRFDNVAYVIGDWTAVKKTEISASEVKQLIACLTAVARICPRAKNASVVNRNDEGLSLVAWYRHLGESLPWQLDIFHETEDAFNFYGLDYTTLTS